MRLGRWETIRELGRGGQGVVHQALDTNKVDIDGKIVPAMVQAVQALQKITIAGGHEKHALQLLQATEQYLSRLDPRNSGALKVLHSDLPDRAKALARLERETAVLSREAHRHIVRILDASVSGGWFVTEYFPEGSLAQHAHRFRGRPVTALEALRPLVEAVVTLHADGIVHRDIAPKNVFVAPHGLVLGDFGLVYPGEVGTRPSGTYENVGSRDWMPPWAMGRRQENPTPAFDVFTLGKLLWVLVSGRHILPLHYFRDPDFDLEAQFPSDTRMVIVNGLLARCIVEREEQCLPTATEMLVVLDEALARLAGLPTLARHHAGHAKVTRAAMSRDDLDRLYRALRGGLGRASFPLTVEALKDLMLKAGTYAIEEHPDLMVLVAGYATGNRGEEGQVALETLHTVFRMAPDSRNQPWAQDARKKWLALCRDVLPPPRAIAWQVVRLLAMEPAADDVESLEQCISEWPPELYGHASPAEWATALYTRHPEPLRAMLESLLETGTEEVQRRVREILAMLRSVDHQRGR